MHQPVKVRSWSNLSFASYANNKGRIARNIKVFYVFQFKLNRLRSIRIQNWILFKISSFIRRMRKFSKNWFIFYDFIWFEYRGWESGSGIVRSKISRANDFELFPRELFISELLVLENFKV